MAFPSVTYTITNGTPNDASQVAQNFTDCINAMKDGTKDFAISALAVAGILTLSSTISSSIVPTTTSTYNLGSSTKGFTAAYFGNSTFTIGLTAPALSASYTLTLPAAVPAATALVTMGTSGILATGATLQTTSPAINRYQFTEGIQPVGSTTGIIKRFSSSTRTLEIADSSTGTARPVVTSAAPSTDGLMIVRGYVFGRSTNGACTIIGEGFTAARTGSGTYTITWSTAFSDTPAVTFSAANSPLPYIVGASGINATVANLTVYTNGGVLADNIDFCFIAAGQRSA